MAATGFLLNHDAACVERNLPPEIPFDANEFNKPSAGAAASVTVTADAGRPIVISQIHCGYDATPAAGSTLKVEDGSGNTVWQVPIPAAGPYEFNFTPNRCGTKNTALIVTLSAGGGAVQGYLNVSVRRHY